MRRFITIFIILTLFINSGLVFLFLSRKWMDIEEDMTRATQSSIENQMTERLRALGRSLVLLEREVNRKSKEDLKNLFHRLEPIWEDEAALAALDPEDLARSTPFHYFYIITPDGTILNTNFEADRGLNTNDYPFPQHFKGFLDGIRERGVIDDQPINLSTITAAPIHYSYYSPPGSNWILEGAYRIDRYLTENYSRKLYEGLFGSIDRPVSSRIIDVTSVDILVAKQNGTLGSLLDQSERKLNDQRAHTLFETGKLTYRNGKRTIHLTRVKDWDIVTDIWGSVYIAMEYDLTPLTLIGRKIRRIQGIVVFLTMMTAVMVALWIINRKIMLPIEAVNRSLVDFTREGIIAEERPSRDFPIFRTINGNLISLERAVQEKEGTLLERQHALEEALEERTELIREVHHRVKNNLQIILSLLQFHSNSCIALDSPDKAWRAAIADITAIALSYEIQHEFRLPEGIPLKDYLHHIAETTLQTADEGPLQTLVAVKGDELRLSMDKAIILGIVASEILFATAQTLSKSAGVREITIKTVKEPVFYRIQLIWTLKEHSGGGLPETLKGFTPLPLDDLGIQIGAETVIADRDPYTVEIKIPC